MKKEMNEVQMRKYAEYDDIRSSVSLKLCLSQKPSPCLRSLIEIIDNLGFLKEREIAKTLANYLSAKSTSIFLVDIVQTNRFKKKRVKKVSFLKILIKPVHFIIDVCPINS